jgi:hypothetical protein
MRIKFSDIYNEPLVNAEVHFELNKTKKLFVTDNEGYIEFTDAIQGAKVTCFINPDDKQKFIFEEGKEISINLIPPGNNMVFVAESTEGKIISGAEVVFEYSGHTIIKTSDNTGQIVLSGIPQNTEVKAYQILDEKEIHVSMHQCLKDVLKYPVKVDPPRVYTDMKIKLVDKSGVSIKNAEVSVKRGLKELEAITGQDGRFFIEKVEIGSTIECKQLISGRMMPWHKLKCDADIDEYILHGEKPTFYTNYNDKLDSQVRVKFRLVNSKGLPIPNAVMRFEYRDHVRNKYSNQNGETMIDDVLIGDKLLVSVDIKGKKVESSFICQQDNEKHEIIYNTGNLPIWFIVIPLALLIALILYFNPFSKSGKTPDAVEQDQELIKKDTVIITNYIFSVKNSKTKQAVAETKIRLIYKDSVIEKYTNQKGIAEFGNRPHKLPVKYELAKFGYFSVAKGFELDSIFHVSITRNDSIEIDPVVAACGTEHKSTGAKISVRTFKMNMAKGRLSIWYNLFNIPTKVEIYNGKATGKDASKLIFSNKSFLKGINNPGFLFESPDSTVTVFMEGISDKTTWVYKLYCARLPVKQNPTTNAGQPVNPNPVP